MSARGLRRRDAFGRPRSRLLDQGVRSHSFVQSAAQELLSAAIFHARTAYPPCIADAPRARLRVDASDTDIDMFPRHSMLAVALFFAAIPTIDAKDASPVLELDAQGEVQIAPDGHVSDYRLQSTLAPEVAALVDRSVRAWQFEPIVVDGKPVVAKTAMHLHLNAEPQESRDSYLVRVAAIDFGEPRRNAKGKAPRYPDEAAHARLGAKVLLSLRLDDAGNVVDAQPYQTSLDARARSEFEAEQWRKRFERASVAAAKSWHYDLTEMVNGKPIGTNAIVPIIYSISESPTLKTGEWKAYVPGPVHPAPWATPAQLADQHDYSALQDGQALSLDSRFRLKEDVVGKTL